MMDLFRWFGWPFRSKVVFTEQTTSAAAFFAHGWLPVFSRLQKRSNASVPRSA